MFFVRLIQMFLGYIKFRADGGSCEKFLNLVSRAGIVLWNIRRDGTGLCASVLASKYKTVEQISKRSGVRLSVISKKGLPKHLSKLKPRLGFILGTMIFVFVIVYFSGYVWTVKVSGNREVSTKEILYTLNDLGISPGVRKNTFDRKAVEQQALTEIPGLSWLHINLDGSVAKVEVGERTKRPELVPDDRPCNIKALYTGQIVKMKVYGGQSVLKVGDTVQEGGLIVSGVIDEPTSLLTRYVHARAAVIAATSHELTVKVPFKAMENRDTGKVIKKYSIDFLSVSVPFYFRVPGGNYRRLIYRSPLVIGGTALPISFNTSAFAEYKRVPVTLTKNQAEKKAESMIKDKEKVEFSGAVIKSKSYTRSFDAGGVTITGKYKCEENIAVTREVKIGET